MDSKLTHVNANGKANMVDVSGKNITERTAIASGKVIVSENILKEIKENKNKKGDVLTVAKIAGIMGGKKTSELIPLCHNIFISKIDIEIELNEDEPSVEIKAFAKTESKTGIEMEALTAVSIAALTVYDMCKAVDKSMIITDIKLQEKTGGKSGVYKRSEEE